MDIKLILNQIYIIVKKNTKRLLQSKISAAMTVFGPLILIFLMGMAFQGSGFQGVKVAVYGTNYTNISDEIIQTMEKSNFEVVKTKSEKECTDLIQQGNYHLCTVFPEDFETGKMEFYVDYSRMNLVYAIINKLSSQIDRISSDISIGTTEDMLKFIGDSGELISSNADTLKEAQVNAGKMETQLLSIRQTISDIDLDSTISLLDELANSSSKTNQQINTLDKNVKTINSILDKTKKDLKETKDTIELEITTIDSAMTTLECTTSNSNDLSGYLQSSQLGDKIKSDSNPTCSLIYSTKIVLEKEKKKLEDTTDAVEELAFTMEEMSGKVKEMQSLVNTEANQTQSQVNNLDENKKSLAEQLQEMAKATNESINSIEEMTDGIEKLSAKFAEISSTDASTVIKPIKTLIKSVTSKKINTLEILFPAIIVMVILFEGILLGNTLIMREKKSRAFFRNQILPVNNILFIIGTYITAVILTLIQVAIVIIVGILAFNVQLTFGISVLPIIIFSILMFASIGMLIGYLSSSDETAILIAVIIAIILLMFSNLVMPTETMAPTLGTIATFTPFNISEAVLRQTLIYGVATGTNALIMTGSFILELLILMTATVLAHRKSFAIKNS